MPKTSRPAAMKLIVAVLALVAAYSARDQFGGFDAGRSPADGVGGVSRTSSSGVPVGATTGKPAAAPSATPSTDAAEVAKLLAAVRNRESDVLVRVPAVVVKTLPDDENPPRHQRFLIAVGDAAPILVAHNIDLAPRVPIAKNDRVEVHGEFEWNDKGGVIHWTHRDPARRHRDGKIKFAGRTYE